MASASPFIMLAVMFLLIIGVIAIIVLCVTKKNPPAPPQQPPCGPAGQIALCPNCGAPVTLGDGRWHCPKCNSGDVLLTPPSQQQ